MVLLSYMERTKTSIKKMKQINNLRSRKELHVLRSLDFRVGMLVVENESDVRELIKYVIPYGAPYVQQAVIVGLAPV